MIQVEISPCNYVKYCDLKVTLEKPFHTMNRDGTSSSSSHNASTIQLHIPPTPRDKEYDHIHRFFDKIAHTSKTSWYYILLQPLPGSYVISTAVHLPLCIFSTFRFVRRPLTVVTGYKTTDCEDKGRSFADCGKLRDFKGQSDELTVCASRACTPSKVVFLFKHPLK